MGRLKKTTRTTKTRKSRSSGLLRGVGSSLASFVGGSRSRGGGGRKHSRQTPEKLARKILVERLKKKLYKLKYGGR